MFPRVQLTINQHWFQQCLGTNKAASHYLNHWCCILLTHICVDWPQWVNLSRFVFYRSVLNDIQQNYCQEKRWFYSQKLSWGSSWQSQCLPEIDRFNTLRSRQNGHNLANAIFKFIFLYENCCILIQISTKLLHKGVISIKQPLVHIMAWFPDAYMLYSACKRWLSGLGNVLHLIANKPSLT